MPDTQEQVWNPVEEARKSYPALKDWSDDRILKNLSNPAKFKAAFPQYARLQDDVIKRNVAKLTKPDYSKEGKYALSGPGGKSVKIPYSLVPEAVRSGYQLTGVDDKRYQKDAKADDHRKTTWAKQHPYLSRFLPDPTTPEYLAVGLRVMGEEAIGKAAVSTLGEIAGGLGDIFLPTAAETRASPFSFQNQRNQTIGAPMTKEELGEANRKVIGGLAHVLAGGGKVALVVGAPELAGLGAAAAGGDMASIAALTRIGALLGFGAGAAAGAGKVADKLNLSPEAKELAQQAAFWVSAGMGGHFTDVEPVEGPFGKQGLKASVGPVSGEVGYRPAYRQPSPEGSYGEGSSIVPGKVNASLSVGDKSIGTSPDVYGGAVPPAPEPKEPALLNAPAPEAAAPPVAPEASPPAPEVQPVAQPAKSIKEEGVPLFNREKTVEDHENWIKTGAQEFAQAHGRDINLPRYLSPDFRAKEIADAYQSMEHNPSDPKVAASYDALTKDIRDQWNYATQKMGINFEPWKGKPGTQPYKDSAEMTADVKNNHHLYFSQEGEIPANHPLATIDPETGFSKNDMLRAVHDLFGHAMESFQFGPRGEENAWNAHAQMFSPEALPALTSETKGQNSWVNFGPQMRDAQGNILQSGQPGWIAPKDRKFAEQKAGLLPDRFQYRLDTPISFFSPNTFNLNMERAGIRLGSVTHRIFANLSSSLAENLRLKPIINSAIGHSEGRAENSIVQHFPMGTNPDAVRYHSAVMARLGNQNAWAAFFPSEGGADRMFAFHIEDAEANPEKIADVLAKNGIKNSTIEPNTEGGFTVWASGKEESVRPGFEKSAEQLGVHDVGEFEGRAESGGSYDSRDAAAAEHTRLIEELEGKHSDWRKVRENVESRPDYRQLHRLIRETNEPFLEVSHGSTKPELVEISPEKYGTGPQKGAEAARKAAWSEYWVPRSYFQIKGTVGERPYTVLPHQYQSLLNSENIYDVTRDPDNLKGMIPSHLIEPLGRFTALEKIIKDQGYDGVYTPDGVVEVFTKTKAKPEEVRAEMDRPAGEEDRGGGVSDRGKETVPTDTPEFKQLDTPERSYDVPMPQANR